MSHLQLYSSMFQDLFLVVPWSSANVKIKADQNVRKSSFRYQHVVEDAVSVTQNKAIHKRATDAFQDSFTPEEVVDYYQKWASSFDKLYEHGFRNMDALDPSAEMLKVCEPKKVYRNLICEYMTDNVTSIESDSYDCIVSSGGMGNGHIPRSALNEMVRIVKPGGYICIAMREEFLTLTKEYNNNKLEGLMADLERAGKWRKMERKLIDYLRNAVGVMFLYQVL